MTSPEQTINVNHRRFTDRERRWHVRNIIRETEDRLKKSEHRRSWIKPWLASYRHTLQFPKEDRRQVFRSSTGLRFAPRSLWSQDSVNKSSFLQRGCEGGNTGVRTPLGTYSPTNNLREFILRSLYDFSGAETSRKLFEDNIDGSAVSPSWWQREEEFEFEEEEVEDFDEEEEDEAVNMAAVPPVPIAVRMGAIGDRTTSVAPLPTFNGWQGSDPDQHLSQFLTACIANNGRTEDVWLRWFPATLKDVAFDWYNRQQIGQFADWETLKDEFLNHFRPAGFEDRLRERLLNSRMMQGEAVESYYGRVADIIKKWPQHNLPDNFILSILVNGLYPPELRMFVKQDRPTSVAAFLARAKVWEECYYDPYLTTEPTMIPAQGTTYGANGVGVTGVYPSITGTTGITGVNTSRALRVNPLQSLPPPPTAYSPYQMVQPHLDNLNGKFIVPASADSNETLLLNLTKKMEELAVNMAKDKEKRPKQTNFRPNIWCSNCKGQGHMVSECPSPSNMKVCCQNCGKNHPTENCWHLMQQPIFNNRTMVPMTEWDVHQVQTGNGYNWNNPRPNTQYRNNSGNFQNHGTHLQSWPRNSNAGNVVPTGQPGSFTKPTWNAPSRFIPVAVPNIPGGTVKRPIRCFRCRQMGHYASECPNERAQEDYVPVCGNCKQNGHTTSECNAPFNFNTKDQRIQPTPTEVFNQPSQDSPVNRVETVAAIQTRGQTKMKDKIILREQLVSGDQPEPVLLARQPELNPKVLPAPDPILLEDESPLQLPIPVVPAAKLRPQSVPHMMNNIPVQLDRTKPQPDLSTQRGTNVLPSKPPHTKVGSRMKKGKRPLGISTNLQPYDIMKDLEDIRPSISMKQLLAIAPECRMALNTSLVRRRHRTKELFEVALNPDPGAPTIAVTIDGVLIPGVQVDGGSSVNLMTAETMEKLGLQTLIPTTLMLRMADHSRVRPVGLLMNIYTVISGHGYKIDYVVFKLPSSTLAYPILLGRPWLYNAKARNDWGKGTLTIGKGRTKIVLQMYPVQYHGESQIPKTEVTSDDDSYSSSSADELGNDDGLHHQLNDNPGAIYQCGGPGEYVIHQEYTDNSDHAIADWMNNYTVHLVSSMEPELDVTNPSDFVTGTEPDDELQLSGILSPVCNEVDLGSHGLRQPIKVYQGIHGSELEQWTNFFRTHKNAFAWTYEDLQGIPPELGEHRIILEKDAKPIRQRQHRLNPKYSMMVKEELDKLLNAGFIYPVPYSEWVSPIVMVPKKNGKIRICQDYRQLNAVTKKDFFPLPFTDSILDAVAGHECYSFLDGFSGYNQVRIAKEDQLKTTFTTDWGTFAYRVMPFGLCNAPATFQRVMTQAFQEYLHVSMEIFLDDFCVFSKRENHLEWLNKCLDQCARFGISLNSEKSTFGVPSGRLLGHLVSVSGIATDPDKVKKIANLPRPDTVSGVRGFVGHVSYYRRFIHAFAQVCQPLTNLLKKSANGSGPVWTRECTVAFETLKQKLVSAPILIPPCWTKSFHVYVDASNVAIGSILSQKDIKGFDHPIYYASRQLNAAERNYSVTEREALGMIYSVQKFRHYLLGYRFVFHVDHDALKYMVNKPQLSGRIARWVLLLQEFDFTMEVRPGKKHANADHLSRLTTELGIEPISDTLPDAALFAVDVISREYAELLEYLKFQTFPNNFTEKMKKNLVVKSTPYTILGDVLYKKGKDGILRRCIFQSEVQTILEGCHADSCGGHFAGESTARKALTAGYWWPTMFKDAHDYVQHCDPCQRIGRPTRSSAMPLVPILAQIPFEKWGIDFVGPIAPPSRRGQKRYILVATDYVTKWAEASAVQNDNAGTVARFLYENIITRFGCPKELVSDRGTHFINDTIRALTDKYDIKHRKTTPYHPRANGQTEKTNGILCKILTKTISGKGTDWDDKLFAALWAYRTAFKVTTNATPFQLVYGTEAILPIELEMPSLRIAVAERLGDTESLRHRLLELERLDETRAQAFLSMEVIQKRRKSYYDSKLKLKSFRPLDYVLLYDSRYFDFPGKFQLRWHGPYRITEIFPNGSVQLEDFTGKRFATRINGNRLKRYYHH